MNSKGIQPRVGMHVSYIGKKIIIKKISGLSSYLAFESGFWRASKLYWNSGAYEIEWIPPTDEERVMFANSARHCRDTWTNGFPVYSECNLFCGWSWDLESIDSERIAESLALDGMDIDDVSKIEELMR